MVSFTGIIFLFLPKIFKKSDHRLLRFTQISNLLRVLNLCPSVLSVVIYLHHKPIYAFFHVGYIEIQQKAKTQI